MKAAGSQQASEEQQQLMASFVDDPINTMRSSILLMLWTELHQRGNRTTFAFKEINYTDASDLSNLSTVRTVFTIDYKKMEIGWIYEHGWKVSAVNFSVSSAPMAEAPTERQVIEQPREQTPPATQQPVTTAPTHNPYLEDDGGGNKALLLLGGAALVGGGVAAYLLTRPKTGSIEISW